ncbi:hypothetical protein ACHHYP_10580 [Achlya hypogyna]|uniref:Dual specificity phosphatase n=1 Tax=Achlya hypogyna TaxID=1202772 RepID=A0A1V9YL04_ACHHY|nr:hypothetical protein ACHHYP_10580 [Achlya hypogyna]
MGTNQSAPVQATEPFSIVPCEPKGESKQHVPAAQAPLDDSAVMSRAARLALEAPRLSLVRPGLFVAGHGVQWPPATGATYALINCASEVLFPEDNTPPPHVRPVLALALRDGPTQEMLPFLPRVLAALTQHAPAIVLCHVGVSRSCTMVIAALMCTEGLSYTDAFAVVKGARSVCSPNPGFLCQLLELDSYRQDSAKRPRVYAFVPHGTHDPGTWILSACRVPGGRSFASPSEVHRHPRGVFIYVDATCLHVWVGAAAPASAVADADHELDELYSYVWRETRPPVVVERDGVESAAFRMLVGLTMGTLTYDSHLKEAPPVALTPSIEPAAVPAAAAVVFHVVGALDEDWDQLTEYDSSDLLPHLVGWLHTATTEYVWLGADRPKDCTAESMEHKLRDAGTTNPIEFTQDGAESEAFWEAFESGY